MSQHTQSMLYSFDLSSSFNHDHKPATLQPVDLTVEVCCVCVYICVCACACVVCVHVYVYMCVLCMCVCSV